MGVDARDIDNDGREDLFVTANTNETFPLFRNLGKGLFSGYHLSQRGRAARRAIHTGWSNGIYDFNNDGVKDLFAACGSIDDNVEEFSTPQIAAAEPGAGEPGGGKIRGRQRAAGEDFQQRPGIAARRSATWTATGASTWS